jgi:hypothetical protein
MKKEIAVDTDDWDFGFSAVGEHELESVQTSTQTADAMKAKADAIYSAILPLLKRLKQDADKDYIFWPNRLPKVEEFEAKLKKIYDSP